MKVGKSYNFISQINGANYSGVQTLPGSRTLKDTCTGSYITITPMGVWTKPDNLTYMFIKRIGFCKSKNVMLINVFVSIKITFCCQVN